MTSLFYHRPLKQLNIVTEKTQYAFKANLLLHSQCHFGTLWWCPFVPTTLLKVNIRQTESRDKADSCFNKRHVINCIYCLDEKQKGNVRKYKFSFNQATRTGVKTFSQQ